MDRPALVPELYVTDLRASLRFYVDAVGFEIEYERPSERFASLRLDRACLMLEQAPALGRATREAFDAGEWRTADLERPFGRGMNLEIRVSDVATIAARLAGRGVEPLLPLHERSYRVGAEDRVVRQLLVADPDGYLIRLSEPVASSGF